MAENPNRLRLGRPIRGMLLNHSWIDRNLAIEWMVKYLGPDPKEALKQCSSTNGAHAKFSFLEEHEASNWRTRQLTGSATLLTGWIISQFHRIHVFDYAREYIERMSKAAWYAPTEGTRLCCCLHRVLINNVGLLPKSLLARSTRKSQYCVSFQVLYFFTKCF